MKTKKVRGHRRRWRAIDHWVEYDRHLDLGYLRQYQRAYTKIGVRPWNGISITESEFAEVRKKTRIKMLEGLMEIYDDWKRDLEAMGVPYYLKIWWYEPRVSQSQVVAAIGESINYYESIFYKPKGSEEKRPTGILLNEPASDFRWSYHWDEDHWDNGQQTEGIYDSEEEYDWERKWLEKIKRKPHRISKIIAPDGEEVELYSFRRGVVWVGEFE
ncbi:hypothetical protein [Persicobacter sp. CCB-QB2]|uniref:hypothetical protein n=1 Tax=Persicobacter sp. CCB-QB2 TaxID=1561025 RepID=UPI0012FB8FDC|nr:hypothetical protein [Persicobacter sp. CCB-QB2]